MTYPTKSKYDEGTLYLQPTCTYTVPHTVPTMYPSKKINMRLPEDLLERLDAYCKRHFTNRTEVVKRLLLELLIEDEKNID
jgi:hypothetical protein